MVVFIGCRGGGSILLSGWCGGRGSGIGCLVFPNLSHSLEIIESYFVFFFLLQLIIKTIVAHREDPTWLLFEIERREPRARRKNIFFFSLSVCVCLLIDLFTGDSAYLVRKLVGRTLKFRRIQVCDVLVLTFD